jgi:diguanylate cyclase (GGDEF)-like protein/PAS domain S-box-containing protein
VNFVDQLFRQCYLALGYGAAAYAAIAFTRYDGGVAFLWGATAILIATLLRTRFVHWPAPILICGTINVLLTGLFGLGWPAALPISLVNVGEAALAAWLLQQVADRHDAMQSLRWFGRFVLNVGVVAPALASLPAMVVVGAVGFPPFPAMVHYFTGHALGNITFVPLALLVTGRQARCRTLKTLQHKARDAALVLPLNIAVALIVFTQNSYPVLFLPVGLIILATFRMGRVGAALGICVLALIGGGATALGYGPTQLIGPVASSRMLFFQFYLAVTVLTVLPVSADLQNRRRMLLQIRLSEERFRMIAEHSADILMHLSPNGLIRYASPAITRIAGYLPEQMVGRPRTDFVSPDYCAFMVQQHEETLAANGATQTYETKGRTADGSVRWFATHARAVHDLEGRIDGVLAIIRDISGQKAREEAMETAALTDLLTGLPNRRGLSSFLKANQAFGAGSTCLALLDLDHFKRINDGYGHGVGDAVLKQFGIVAKRMLRADDYLARIGGEEFVVVLPNTEPKLAMAVCDRLRAQLASGPMIIGRDALHVTVSGGVTLLGNDGMAAALQRADEALYAAKHDGRDQLRLAA